METRLVMTCHRPGWLEYGRKMVETFVRHWHGRSTLEVYAEGFDLDVHAGGVYQRALPAWHDAFKARHAENMDAHGRNRDRFGKIALRKNGGYDYRRDCVKFSHKVAALTDAASRPGVGVLIMCDADVITHADVTPEWLTEIFPDPGAYMAWLDRRSWYPECGFVMFRETHPAHAELMRRMRATYESDQVFNYRETHDSFVLQQVVEKCVRERLFLPPWSLSGKAGRDKSHPFVHSALGSRMDHLKGKLKSAGRTPAAAVARKESYWR